MIYLIAKISPYALVAICSFVLGIRFYKENPEKAEKFIDYI